MRSLSPVEMFSLAFRFVAGSWLLKKSPSTSREEMRAWQFQRIRKLVGHAYKEVPFYREFYARVSFEPGDLKTWEDFHKLPVVTKEDVVANYPDSILQRGCDVDEIIVSRSSGSSGKVLDIAYDSKAMITYILAGLRLYQMGFNYRPWHHQVYVYTSKYPLNSLFGLYPLHFVSTLTPLGELIQLLTQLKPALLVCYPSHLKQIGELASDGQRGQMQLQAISVNSEMSTQTERDYLSMLFGCPVLDEYSSEELTRIAAQCLHKNYHVFEDINYIEVLDDQLQHTNEVGTIVGTNLHNFVMPMIRYNQDDRGRIHGVRCECGWTFRTLTEFEGRRNDSFIMPSGRVLSSGFLLDATYEFLLNYRTCVSDFCLIQVSAVVIVLQIVPGKDWSGDIQKNILNRFKEFLEDEITFRVDVVEECEKTKSGKRNPIINMMNRADQ